MGTDCQSPRYAHSCARPSKASSLTVPSQARSSRKGCAWRNATTTTRCVISCMSSALPPIFAHEERRPKPSRLQSAAVGGGAGTFVDEPLSSPAHPLGQKAGELSGLSPFRLRLDRFSLCRNIWRSSPRNRLNILLTYMIHTRWTKKLALLSSVAYYKARSSRCLTKALVEELNHLVEKAPLDRRYHDDRQDSRP